MKRIVGVVLLVAFASATAVPGVLRFIGFTTIPEDASNIPTVVEGMFEWLLSQPTWVSVLVWAALVGCVCWLLWPDFTLVKQVKEDRQQLKESNDRAWQFQADFAAHKEEVAEMLRASEDRMAARIAESEDRLASRIGDSVRDLIGAQQRYDKLSKDSEAIQSEIHRRLSDLEMHTGIRGDGDKE